MSSLSLCLQVPGASETVNVAISHRRYSGHFSSGNTLLPEHIQFALHCIDQQSASYRRIASSFSFSDTGITILGPEIAVNIEQTSEWRARTKLSQRRRCAC